MVMPEKEKEPGADETPGVEQAADEEEVADENEKSAALNQSTEAVDGPEEQKTKLIRFPLARVKHIMKLDPDLLNAGSEAAFLVAKATELFVESLAVECFTYTQSSGRKTVTGRDFESALAGADCLAFLEGALDEK